MTPDEIRIHHGVRWRQLWWRLGYDRLRDELPLKPLVIEASKRKGTCTHWLVEAALCEAMRDANGGLQTDIEDFVPTTQPKRRKTKGN